MTYVQTTYEQTTLYPNMREMLSPEFAGLPDAALEAAFESAFGEGVSPAEYEEFFGGLGRALGGAVSDIGKFAGRAAPVAGSVASGALQGAMTGSALGPWGALAGAVAGGVGSGLSQHGRGAARDVGNVLGGVMNTAGALSGRGGMAAGLGGLPGGRGGGAANQLMGLLGRPETLRAIQALAGGQNRAIPVGAGGTPVPASAFAGLLGALAREAEAESFSGSGESLDSPPAYLMNGAGQFVVDPSQPDQRAARLLQMLQAAPPLPRARPVPWQETEAYDDAEDAEEEAYFDTEDTEFELFEADETDLAWGT
ncbi:hypothetical protein E5F05_06125 [Deinococcus metallilatus]|uniref:Uncharacterized protein n=1 Tax=Deinococcus metallilatus TaxID=1211322 RepID=A0AAJ5F847_9DEIO|nr:hypothetical protein [Deinococcus metallilatus]MBB5294517.1 hypothetical protein [Deinococcus metallilatus]QBY07566.1 hypothetical protein E5F05_06125 [Deinococcus metallilatus]RXJ13982.1 hypothetical protein ERJ73_04960 [Deinococcus metallilatus]TLK29947.1 hypothetical protein FCS05_05275 [Deinococcus metallilatus]GMA15732.1 hypothetical protein GCM10025871_20630 [Deinococcus metallilatus]